MIFGYEDDLNTPQNTTVKPTVKQPVEDNLTATSTSVDAQRPNETGTGDRKVSHRNKDERLSWRELESWNEAQ